MTVVEQARATKDLIDSYIKLTGDSTEVKEQDKIEGVSEKTQQIFFNLFQDNRNVESSEDVILDDVSEIELIQELEVMGYFEEDMEPMSRPGPAG